MRESHAPSIKKYVARWIIFVFVTFVTFLVLSVVESANLESEIKPNVQMGEDRVEGLPDNQDIECFTSIFLGRSCHAYSGGLMDWHGFYTYRWWKIGFTAVVVFTALFLVYQVLTWSWRNIK